MHGSDGAAGRGVRMASLGWRLLEGKAGYRLALPKLSEEECGLVLACAKRIASRAETTEAPGTAGARQAALDEIGRASCRERV